MKLTREQRSALFGGELPRIAGEGECPWKPGQVYQLSERVKLTVLEIRKVKPKMIRGKRIGEGWSLRYSVADERDNPRLLRPTPHPADFDAMRKNRDQYGFPLGDPDDPRVLREAGIDSAYTSNRGVAMADAGEAVGEDWLKRFSKEAGQRLAKERQQEYDRKKAKARASTLREVELRARQRGLDVNPQLDAIDAQVQDIRRKLDEAA